MSERDMNDESALVKLTDEEIERRKVFVGLTLEDIRRITAVRDIVVERADAIAEVFFQFLSSLPEAQPLFRRHDLLAEARRRKRDHLVAMVGGDYGRHYVEQRLRLGDLYARIGLDVRVFLGAYRHLIRAIGDAIVSHAGKGAEEAFADFMSLQKIAFFDLGLIIDVISAERERVIRVQQEAIRELSTPVLQVRDRLLILPIIGVLDSFRAKQLTEGLLHAIRANRAKVVVVDITGVAAVDSQVANHLIQTVAASRLMGAQVIITGISGDVAQALVALGVDLRALNSVGDLQGGIEEAERILGYTVTRTNPAGLSG
jgi:rsbT co-antagonist protein RsbR